MENFNLASSGLGSDVVFATDEWFAAAENLLKDGPAEWRENIFTTYGKWMDGWECRRRRTEGHDWCIIRLGLHGTISSINVDTSFFTGNFSPSVSIQGIFFQEEPIEIMRLTTLRKQGIAIEEDGRMGTCASREEFELAMSLESHNWPFLVELSPLRAGYSETCDNKFSISNTTKVSHIRLNMGPDGGIARLRLYGSVTVDATSLPADTDIDLASVKIGGIALACSNKHYGQPSNMLLDGRGTCMGDGWETARQPARPAVYQSGPDGLLVLPGCDWSIFRLGAKGVVNQIIVDTNFYKGNYPESCMVEACNTHDDNDAVDVDSRAWKVLLPRTRLGPSAIHAFSVFGSQASGSGSGPAVVEVGEVSHVKLTIYPDGGVMRLRIIGRRSLMSSKL